MPSRPPQHRSGVARATANNMKCCWSAIEDAISPARPSVIREDQIAAVVAALLAAYLSTNLPLERLNVAMGAYVSATVAGGLGGRLLGGFIHSPLHWRYAFVTASLLYCVGAMAVIPSPRSMVFGLVQSLSTPAPGEAPPAMQFDDVTYG